MMYPVLSIPMEPPKLQKAEVVYRPMPMYEPSVVVPREEREPEASSNQRLYWTLLCICLPLFVLWDGLAIYCNFGTMLKFFGLKETTLIIAAVLFFVTAVLKLYSMVVATITLITPESPILKVFEQIQIVTILVSTAAFIFTTAISLTLILPGTFAAIFFDFVLHFGTAGLSALLWLETPHPQFAFVLVPQRPRGF